VNTLTAATTSFVAGGCISTTGNYVCITIDCDATATTAVYIQGLKAFWLTKKAFSATTALAGTTITLAKW
jgi:hypothetical protein